MRKILLLGFSMSLLGGCHSFDGDFWQFSEPSRHGGAAYQDDGEEYSSSRSRSGGGNATGPSISSHRPSRAASTRLQAGTEEHGVSYKAPSPASSATSSYSSSSKPAMAPIPAGTEMVP